MRRLIAAVAFACAGAGCASVEAPPGGPPDKVAPVLVSTTPDSGASGVTPRTVVFTFNEVVRELPNGALSEFFLISPRVGRVSATWHRNRIEVRPRAGWRPNTTYSVVLRRGIGDLRNNATTHGAVTLFSTGPAIASSRIRGVVFDWLNARIASDALVEAVSLPDSTTYVTATDSLGHFDLSHIPQGVYMVRAFIDTDRDQVIDRGEMWAGEQRTLQDSLPSMELLTFVHDSTPPHIVDVQATDSVTIRITLDHPLNPEQLISAQYFQLVTPDSTPVPLAQIRSAAAYDKLRQDAARVRDSSAGTIPLFLQSPTTGRTPARPAEMPSKESPVLRIVMVTQQPMKEGDEFIVRARNIVGLLGVPGNSERHLSILRGSGRGAGAGRGGGG